MSEVFLAPRDLVTVTIDDDHTLGLTDAGKSLDVDGAVDTVIITVPDNATVPLPVGAIVEIVNLTTNTVEIAGDGGVTVRSFDENDAENGSTATRTLAGRYAAASLRKLDTDDWLAIGQFEEIV